MSIRSKLRATVAIPVMSVCVFAQPSFADMLSQPYQVAQENSEERAPQEQSTEQPPAEGERPSEEGQGRRHAEEQKQAEQEEAQRQAEERKRAEQEEARRQEVEKQQAEKAEAARQAEERKAAEAETQRQAAEEKKAAEEAAAQQKAAEQAQRKAEEQQKAEQEAAERQAEKQKQEKAAADEAEKQAAEQKKAAEQETQRQAQEKKPAPEESAPKGEAEPEQQAPAHKKSAAKTPDASGVSEETAKEPVERPKKKPAPADDAQAQKPEPQPESAPAPVQPTEPQTGETSPVQPSEQPAVKEQHGKKNREQSPVEQQPAEQPQEAEKKPEPVPAIVDKRSAAEKEAIAKDPSKTDETVVLPVENGAAILDSDKDADNSGGNQAREQRRKQRGQQRETEASAPPPADDASAQVAIPEQIKADLPKKIEANLKEKGKRVDEAPAFVVPETTNIVNNTVVNNTVVNNTTVNNVTNNVSNVKVLEQVDNRVVMDVGDRMFVRGDDRPRLRRNAEEAYYDELPRGRMRETIVRPGGYRVVTVYDRYGDVVQRSRIDRDGNEYLMVYAPDYEDTPRAAIADVGYDLPPMRLTIPVSDYIIDVTDDRDRDFYDFLAMPPVERVERVYTIDEVRHSARLRDKVRRIDLDTIHFATGSAEVSLSQAKTLRKVADAMQKILAKDPGETFFIEGHTDAVGSDRSNLVLSDKRAESVASLLTEVYDIPAENLVTQGYGERFLKIKTDGPEQENRRVTIRRVTPLVRPVAQR
jgi:outer membrane protein OmpA-like peptidoglycan-associated protein